MWPSETVALAPIGAPFSSPKGKSVRLRCASDVAVVQAADLGQSDDAAVLGWLDGAAIGCILLEREMRPRAVVVAEVTAQTTTEMSVAQDDHVIEKVASDGADHSLGEPVRESAS